MAVLASFLGAFLLFAIQPLAGKSLLPIYGGGAGPWIACMLFFQLVLLGGYGYAHGLARRLGTPAFLRIHGALALASLGVLALGFRQGAAPWLPAPGTEAGSAFPPLAILGTLAVSAGAPLLLLASTSPLIQAAFASLHPGKDPYRLYAVSNAGSLGGLLSYPFLVEPFLDLKVQAWVAALLFVVYLGLLFVLLSRVKTAALEATATPVPVPAGVAWMDRWKWIGLSALGTLWLCAVTNRISTDVASMPLLWIPPLAAYLLTFILVFETSWSFSGPGWRVGLILLVAVLAWILGGSSLFNALHSTWGTQSLAVFNPLARSLLWLNGHLAASVALTIFAGAAACLLVHARLGSMRPAPMALTEYYLCISVGGATGGLFVSLLAPILFDQAYELGLATAITGGLVVLSFRQGGSWLRWPGLALGTVTAGLAAFTVLFQATDRTRFYGRDFFGTLNIQYISPGLLKLYHGGTSHGLQFAKEPLRPASYYGNDSGIGVVLRTLNRERTRMRVGLVGLGVGNTAAFGRAGDEYVFFEISPKIIEVAGLQGTFFSVLKSTPATVRVLQGDGRLLADSEAKAHGPYDVLLIDAFAGGHIPAHLLTVEALAGYASNLKEGGVLVLHVSHHLPLDQQAAANLKAAGLTGLLIPHGRVLERLSTGGSVQVESVSAYWIVSRRPEIVLRPEFLRVAARAQLQPGMVPDSPELTQMASMQDVETAALQPWTDQRHGLSTLLFHALRGSGGRGK
ncbi:MAG: hypothetical protein IPL96_14865 [Holophagaceae bacterium]|nr:hypothetical protein [Holophagaceae bacterium]